MSLELEDTSDDAWSYSYPPSLATAEAGNGTNPGVTLFVSDPSNDDIQQSDYSVPLTISKSVDSEKTPLATRVPRRIADISSVASSKNSSQLFISHDAQSIQSGSLLQSPIGVGKSLPADPHTTMEDANSTFSTAEVEEKFTPSHSRSGSQWRNTMEVFKDDLETSPRMISFRKNNRRSNSITVNTAELPKEKFDERLFVDEFFRETKYRYATMKRNIDFHQLFRSLDLTDRFMDDYACALSREILLQGRLYVSEHNVCFNSNLLGWVTHVIIPMDDIINFEKKSTAGLFPNGIVVETKETRYNFASFISRDTTFDFLSTVWSETTGRKLQLEPSSPQPALNGDDSNGAVATQEGGDDNSHLESYILSIDGDDEDLQDIENIEDGDESYDDFESQSGDENSTTVEGKSRTIKILKFKEGLKHKNMGPEVHGPTKVDTKFFVENEVVMSEMEFSAPLGIVYDLLFGDSDTSFITKFIEDHGGSEITAFDVFQPMESDPTKLERTYNYRLELGYAIGPKSTKCEVAEIIEHLNFADCVVVEKITRTPDVPLGTSFSVRNRFYFSWGSSNSTLLRSTYYINWTGSSWIKGVIEKQTNSGQRAANEDMMEALNAAIKETTYEAQSSTIEIMEKVEKPSTAPQAPVAPRPRKQAKTITKRKRSPFLQSIMDNFRLRYLVAFIIVFIVTWFQMKLYLLVKETNLIAATQLSVTARLASTLNEFMQENGHRNRVQTGADSELWTWVKTKHNRDLGTPEKIEYLANQLALLYGEHQEKDTKHEFKLANFRDFWNNLL